MPEYIEREKAKEYLAGDYAYAAAKLLDDIPAADVAEVVHGKWLKTDAYPHKIFCSVCYATYVTNEEAIQGRSWQHPVYCTEAEYCPHCGAKMDKERRNK